MAEFSGEPVFLLWSQQGSDNRPGAWYVPNHFVPLYSVEAGHCNDSDTDCKDEPNPKFVNVNLHLGADAPIKCIEDKTDLHKKTAVVPEEGKKKIRQSSDKGIIYSKGTKRGCLEQFGFLRKSSSLKKTRKEDPSCSESAVCEEKKNCFPPRPPDVPSPHVFSKSPDDLVKVKSNSYEEIRVGKFQWNWLSLFPWLRISMQRLSSDVLYDLSHPYPQLQPPSSYVPSLFCDVCSKQPLSSFDTDISNKTGTKVLKIESQKKHEKSQTHASCVTAFEAH